ncbi:glycosyltransferase family 4 protein [Orenia marismortui]|uniref:glycosyltransferase family 4 protein n=1 Tax=Orenia marismortui TaxID=46469 RepID=UPI00036B29D7|nr:MraY family glycosyltransferase [Orenia marismortui]
MFIYPLLLALLSSYFVMPQVKKLAFKLGAVDYPNKRRINIKPIPSLGGLGIYFGVLIALLVTGFSDKFIGIIAAGTLVVILGLLDDLYELSAKVKLLGQVLVALVLISFGIKIRFISNPFGGIYYLGILSIPTTLVWIISTINVINLIDGLDGLAGGVSVIATITLAIFAYQQGQVLTVILALTVIGAVLGFLKYNFNPADIFMGDTGSMFLGFMLGSISIIGTLKSVTFITLLIPVLALGVPIIDTLLAILRRKLAGRPIFKADKGHLHHKLLELGLNQIQVVMIIYLISISLGMIAIGVSEAELSQQLFLIFSSLGFILIGIIKLGIVNLNTNYNKRV